MSKKALTIVIPAYNVEDFLANTTKSLIKCRNAQNLEILIINDGSTDQTSAIAHSLEKEYPHTIKVINKKNGGHGSAINYGIMNANGKYFRLLDGDDWYDPKELDIFLDHLKNEEADLILSNYSEILLKSHTARPIIMYSNLKEYTILDLKNVKFKNWGPLLPTTTIKTELLKKSKFKIDENCFYVDQEYNLLCYSLAETMIYYPLSIYQYRLERDNQSMQKESLIRNVSSHEKVCIRLLNEYVKRKEKYSSIQQQYLENKVIIPLCNTQYVLATNYCKSRKAFLSFDEKLKKFSEFYDHPLIAGSRIHLYRLTNGFLIKTLEKFNNRTI